MSDGPAWAAVRWSERGVVLLDQRALPEREAYLELGDVEEVATAIEDLVVRGAPAIGCTAALGIALAAQRSRRGDLAELGADLDRAEVRLARTRPTAVNLFWALERMRARREAECARPGATPDGVAAALLDEALHVLDDDVRTCRSLGAVGASLIPARARVLTHCNAGALATGGYGTALGVVRAAVEAGASVEVLADETRPFLQGARLTAWELQRDGIPVSVIADNMAAHLMRAGEIDLVIVGADRIARNGDVANKIGTYGLAVLARAHDIPFYVAAPCSTIDASTASGAEIPIEERSRAELATLAGRTLVPDGVPVRHPAFDVTPAELVSAIVTERGIARAPYEASLGGLLSGA